jgi:HPt (histidine-containing phosphotransfer) domain-containing protein
MQVPRPGHEKVGAQLSELSISRLWSYEAGTIFDRSTALDQVEGDEQLLSELVGLFLNDYHHWLIELRQVLASGDLETVTQIAHTLKGAAASIGASTTHMAAMRLEQFGHAADLSLAAAAFASLEVELERLTPVLMSFVKEVTP